MQHNWNEYEGQLVDGYQLNSFLGMRDAKAFYVTHTGANAIPALMQVTLAEIPAAEGQLANWTRAAKLSNKHLIELHATGRASLADTPIVYAVTELPDDDLSEILPKRTLTKEEAKSAVAAVGSALEYLHNKELAHRAVIPSSIFMVGKTVKLAADTISPASGEADRKADLLQLDALAEKLSLRPKPAMPKVHEQTSRGPQRAPAALLRPTPQPTEASRVSRAAWSWIAAAAVVLVLIGFFAFRGPQAPSQTSVAAPAATATPPPASEIRPSPVRPQTRARTAAPVRDSSIAQPGWAVITATYSNFSAAEKRAKILQNQWPDFKPQVFPSAGQGRLYYVVLGSGLTKKDAESLHRRARAAGLPSDTYVTRLGNG